MNSQTLHIDSTYRDRVQYPNPAEFTVPYGAPSGNTVFTMTNPVTNELPVYNFVFPQVSPYSTSIAFLPGSTGATAIPNNSLRVGISSWNSTKIILEPADMIAIFGDASAARELDFLKNLYFVYGATPSSPPFTVVRILEYDSLTFTITLQSPVVLDLAGVANFGYLYNDSTVTATTFKILLTGSLSTFQRNYVRKNDMYLYNATRNSQHPVTLSDDGIYLLPRGGQPATIPSWSVNDYYVLFNCEGYIRRMKPFPDGMYVSYSASKLTLMESSSKFPMNRTYVLIQLEDDVPSSIQILVTSIDPQGRIRKWDIANRGFNVKKGRSYYIQDTNTNGDNLYAVFRVDDTYQSFLVEGPVSITPNEFFTPFVFTPLMNHTGTYINDEITHNIFPTVYIDYNTKKGVPYNQLQNITGVSAIYDTEASGTDTIVFTTAYCDELIRSLDTIPANNWWNSVVFSTVSMDQYVPLNYSGSTVSQDQLVCHEIELLNLILPNLELNATRVLTSFYPYIFVELSNSSTFTRNVNSLFTNNQFGQSALFAVPISDVNSPETSQFLNLDNCKSIQTIKFKPNDALNFRVFLTNGETFTPYLKDTLPPLSPNPLVQVSAVFSIRRVG